MICPTRRMPARFRWQGEIVAFVDECGKGLRVRHADGTVRLVWWSEVEPAD